MRQVGSFQAVISSENRLRRYALLEPAGTFFPIFLRNTSLGDFYYSGVYTCFRPPSMRHFQIAVPTRHYLHYY